MATTVLFVETGSGFGGSAVCLDYVVRHLDRSRYRAVVAYNAVGLGVQRIQAQGIKTVRLNRGFSWLQLVDLIQREKVDIVHANNELYSHFASIMAARWARRPCVVHMRGIRKLTRLERSLIPRVEQFIILSKFGREFYIKEGIPREKTQVIYDGIDLSAFNGATKDPQIRKELGIAQNKVVVGIVSRLIRKKGHRDFLEASRRLALAHANVQIIIVGGDPDPKQAYFRELKLFVKNFGLGSRVIFTGWRDDIPALTESFDIAVQTSHFVEGFGTAVLEAMAAGKPVVATAVGGIPEVVQEGKTAFLVPPGSPTALAEAIERLVVNADERRRFGAAGRQRVERLFDQRNLITSVTKLYGRWMLERKN